VGVLLARRPGRPRPGGELGLHDNGGQRVTEQIVQVAGDPAALVLGREANHFGASGGEFAG